MLNLRDEASYLRGARDVLLRLMEDYEFYAIPYKYVYTKDGVGPFVIAEQSPKKRKMFGEAMIRALIYDKNSMRKFMVSDYKSVKTSIKRTDKKGNIVEIKIELV